MTIDLSFTKDSDWIKKREKSWRATARSLSQDLDKETVEAVEYYYMTGEFKDGKRISDGACFCWFPLQTTEGWNYILEYIVKDTSVFEEEFYYALTSQEGRLDSDAKELALWDYFHPKAFRSIVNSKVKVGKNKEFVEMKVDHYKVARSIISSILTDFESSDQEQRNKLFLREEYFFSVLPYLEYDKSAKYKKMARPEVFYRQFRRLAIICLDKERQTQINDKENYRIPFLEKLKNKLDSNEALPEKMREVWEDAKKEYTN